MKRQFHLALILMSILQTIPLVPAMSQGKSPQLPEPIKAYLDSAYSGWQLSKVSPQLMRDFFSSGKILPNVTRGDFDQDGSRDYAVLITHGDSLHRHRMAIAFLSREHAFLPYVLETEKDDEETYITVTKKGTRGYDWEKEKSFTYPSDGIDVVYGGKAGVTYFFKQGKFVKMYTAD